MSQHYTGHGIAFEYPELWTVAEANDAGRISIFVQSPGTSFWSVHLHKDNLEPGVLIDTAIQAFRQEYEEIDISEDEVKLSRHSAIASDLDFVCLDLVNRAFLRAFQASGFSILVLYQGTDFELEEMLSDLVSISESLVLEAEENNDF